MSTKQIIKKDNVIKCVTTIPYSQDVVKEMKRLGYKIATIEENEDEV